MLKSFLTETSYWKFWWYGLKSIPSKLKSLKLIIMRYLVFILSFTLLNINISNGSEKWGNDSLRSVLESRTIRANENGFLVFDVLTPRTEIKDLFAFPAHPAFDSLLTPEKKRNQARDRGPMRWNRKRLFIDRRSLLCNAPLFRLAPSHRSSFSHLGVHAHRRYETGLSKNQQINEMPRLQRCGY